MDGSDLAARVRLALAGPSRVVSIAGGTEHLLGFRPGELLSSRISLRERIHPDDADVAARLFAPDLADCAGWFNLRVRHGDGRIRCLCGEYTKERESGDGPVFVELVLRDPRSYRVAGFDAITGSFKILMERNPDFLYLKDRNHVYRAMTHSMASRAAEVLGIASVLGLTVYDIYSEELADRVYRLDKKVLTEGERVHEIQRLNIPDGSHLWIDNRKYPLRNEAGEMIGLFGICPDITQPIDAANQVHESRELLQLFIEHAPAALAMLDRDMRYMAVSRRWEREFGIGSRNLIGCSHYEIFPKLSERRMELHRRALAGETVSSEEDRVTRADGTVQWARWEMHPWLTSDGTVGGILLFAEEVSQQKRDRERLQLAASVFTHAREGITICDPAGNILDVNEMFTRITGYSREEVLGKNPSILQSGRQSAEFYADMWRALGEKGQWSGEIWNKAKDGRIYPQTLTITAVHDRAENLLHYVGFFSDITQEKEQERQLERSVHYDVLTDLPNRTLLADRLQQAMAQAHRHSRMLAVVCLDLDGFRRINAVYGRDAGDRVLMGLARRMKLVLRETDSLARLGGDKFVAVLLDVESAESVHPVLDRMLAGAAEAASIGEIEVSVPASMGVTFYPQMVEIDAGQLLRQAEQAMYQSKLAGKNRWQIFDVNQDITVRAHLEDVERIRVALAAGEFVLYYQPTVNMSTGSLVGVEGLIRWQHPTRGLLPPATFLPAILEDPLFERVGDWVLEQALRQLEAWQDGGLKIQVSVNIGARHLRQTGFAERLRALLAAHPGVPASALELEVLETSALLDIAQVSHVLTTCRDLGVSIALDDFGTGYSSLTWLRRLPVNIVKIDQSFVGGMHDNPEDLSILEGVLGLARAFDRTAVAEGVETIEQGRLLLQFGCNLGQGYAIARPMPAEELLPWAGSWKPDPVWTTTFPVGPGKRLLLQAVVAHRAWAAALEAFLQGDRPLPPPSDPRRCRFGVWLERERLRPAGTSPAFYTIDQLHRQAHHLADRLSDDPSRVLSADGRIREVHRLRDSLDEMLELLLTDSVIV